MPAAAVIAALGLAPHPEGGHYRETYRAASQDGGRGDGGRGDDKRGDGGRGNGRRGNGQRGAATAILFLLAAGERSHWHRVDAAEIWLHQGGDPLSLAIAADDHAAPHTLTLGPDLAAGQVLQGIVPPHAWQAATPLGRWALVSCIVAPAFDFAGFTLAAPGWSPGPSAPGRSA